MQNRMQALAWFGAALAAGAAGAFLFSANLHTDDTGIIAGLIFLSAAAVAFVFRKPGLIFGSLMGFSILLSELWNHAYGLPRSHMGSFRDFILLLLFVTAMSVAGSFTGFKLRHLFTHSSIKT